jgi:hypothetical protein
MTPEIETICARFKKATDAYCDAYPRQGMGFVRFEQATRTYDSRKRAFNKAVQVAIQDGGGKLPDWAKETLAYQTERGFLDPIWKTWPTE